MTIRKRLSRTNTRILLFALLSLLVIGVFIIEIFEKTYLEQAINYVKLQDHSVELVDFLDEYQFSEDEIGTLGKKIRSYGHNFYIAKDRQRVSTDFSTKQLREMQYLDSYVTINEPADVFVWRTATMIFKSYETETGTYQVVALRNDENTRQINPNRETYRWLIPIFTAIGVLAIAIIVGISRYFSRKLENRIMEPIEKLIDAANRVEDGNFEEHVEYEGEEEFEKLCHSFNTMQDSLAAGVDRAEEYDKAKTEMIAGMSHDLRTPLTSIKGYIKGVKDGVANTPQKQEQYLDIAYQKACAMDVLLRKLSDFSKLETGNMPMEPVATDFGAFLQEMLDDNEQYLREKDVNVIFFVPEEKVITCIDHEQTKRVLRNIMENSMKYRCREQVLIRMNLIPNKESVILKITDDGEGVPEEKLPHLFEQFYRGDETRNSRIDGDGLGLYIAKRIIEQQGGSISTSNHGGFCITIILPRVGEEQEQI